MKNQEQTLLEYFHKLSEQDAHALLRFAAFLAGKDRAVEMVSGLGESDTTSTSADLPKPEIIPRPENERVVDALKRLSTSYPMLDKKPLLDKASGMVAQHVMFGKPAKVVIDEIEALFSEAYEKFIAAQRTK